MHSGGATRDKSNILHITVLIAALVAMHRISYAQVVTVIPPVPLMRDETASEPSPAPEAAPEGREGPSSLPLILNDSVENQIAFFTSVGRAQFQNWLNHSSRYLPVMKEIFREYNLPEDLAYLPMIESGFDPFAVSPKKAVGLWQFMGSTAREYGLLSDRWVDERRDPIKSTRAAAAYLRDLHNLFGSWPLALASYNGGTGNVQNAVLRVQSDDFWDIRDSRHIRRETRNYVPRFMAALIIAKDPPAYGFTVPPAEPFDYDEIQVRNSTDLREIARFCRCSPGTIAALNPELIGPVTPLGRYVVRIPRGAKPVYEAELARARRRQKVLEEQSAEARSDLLLAKLAAAGSGEAFSPLQTDNIVPRFGVQLSLADERPSGLSGKARGAGKTVVLEKARAGAGSEVSGRDRN